MSCTQTHAQRQITPSGQHIIQSKLFYKIKIQFKFKQTLKRCNANNVDCLTPWI